MANRANTGVGGCGGGCSDFPRILVPRPCVIEPGALTPRQAAQVMHDDGTYGDWVEDVPIQGPTDRDIRTAGCWWKDNVLDKATDSAGRIVPQWTQNSLCIGNRMMNSGIGGVGETVRRGGALGADAALAAGAPPGIWSKLAPAEAQWVLATLAQLNALILKSGNKPCATWPADPTKAMPAAVACFQGWYNANVKPGLSTDGTLDRETLCALVAVTKEHAADFPTPYPGTALCLSTLSLPMKIGIGVAAVAVVSGTVAAIAHSKKKRPATGGKVSEARHTTGYQVLVFNHGSSHPETVARVNTEAEAERLKDHYEKQANQRGWNKRVEIRPVRG